MAVDSPGITAAATSVERAARARITIEANLENMMIERMISRSLEISEKYQFTIKHLMKWVERCEWDLLVLSWYVRPTLEEIEGIGQRL